MFNGQVCPNCGATLAGGVIFCYNCGLNLTHPKPPPLTGGPAGENPVATPGMMAPGAAGLLAPLGLPMPPMGMPFGPGMTAPLRAVGHHKAVSSIAGILLIFTASCLVIVGLAYTLGYGWSREYYMDEWGGTSESVIHWNFILGGVLEFVAFGMGLASGIYAIKTKRWTLTFAGAILVAIGASLDLIAQELDVGSFLFVLGLLALAMLFHARPAYTTIDGRLSNGTQDRAAAYGFR